MEYRSILDPTRPAYKGAKSEQDYLCAYTDTVILEDAPKDAVDQRPHKPILLKVYQASYGWSYTYADDFVLVNYRVENISNERIWDMYIGLWGYGNAVYAYQDQGQLVYGDYSDDLTGFLMEHPTEYSGCRSTDTVAIAWFADNDGDYHIGDDRRGPLLDIVAVRMFPPNDDLSRLSYNWYVYNPFDTLDWQPQAKRTYRQFIPTEFGNVEGDRNVYHLLRNGETDYDQVMTARIAPTDNIWVYPDQKIATDVSDGQMADFVLSAGRYALDPGQSMSFTVALLRGHDFHKDPDNFQHNIEDNYDPEAYYRNVDFSDIAKNAMWASWVYDNPGYDTDGDGYAGKYRWCCTDSAIVSIDSSASPPDTTWDYGKCEKVWYEGDGIPDFRAAAPPPEPRVQIKPEVGRVRVRWNGTYSETAKDIFTKIVDFEGYRVYYSLDERESSYTLLASYDRENYDKFIWEPEHRVWEVGDIPISLQECRCLYADSCNDESFNPLDYSRGKPFFMPGFPDSIFYFASHDFNQSGLGVTTPILKVYPDQPYPSSLIPDSAQADELTEDGLLKYFEYEYTIEDILPTVRYYVSVTAFDYGSPASNVHALESSKTDVAIMTYPTPDSRDVRDKNLKVYIYPNPYRGDAGYYEKGFEGRDAEWYIPDRMHRIHFANLPAKCTISIFSLDGDLVREWEHDMDPNDPASSHDEWDLITRNTQRVVSGIYYWTVAEPDGKTQIGKLVIIK